MQELNSDCQAFVAGTSTTEPLCRPREISDVLVIVLPNSEIDKDFF